MSILVEAILNILYRVLQYIGYEMENQIRFSNNIMKYLNSNLMSNELVI